MNAVGVALAVLCLLTLILLALEVRSYASGRTLITARRLVLRLIAGVILLALLAAVYAGLFLLDLRSAEPRPQVFAAYWLTCLLLAFVLMWVMMMDLREVETKFEERKQRMWEDMARFVEDRTKQDEPSGDTLQRKGKA
jgi:hypothetical protein